MTMRAGAELPAQIVSRTVRSKTRGGLKQIESFRGDSTHELSRRAGLIIKSAAPMKKVCLPERSTRPMQRTSVPWQWGQMSLGAGEMWGDFVVLGSKRRREVS